MQPEPLSENGYESSTSVSVEQRQYTIVLHEEMSENTEGMVYFSLPDQENDLYEYEGDLDEVLQDLPEIYATIASRADWEPLVQANLALTPQASAVIEQLWDYFDRTGENIIEGTQDYNVQVEGDWLLVVPKDNSQGFVAVSRDGQVESTFSSEQQENLMQRFAIAYEHMQRASGEPNKHYDWELV